MSEFTSDQGAEEEPATNPLANAGYGSPEAAPEGTVDSDEPAGVELRDRGDLGAETPDAGGS